MKPVKMGLASVMTKSSNVSHYAFAAVSYERGYYGLHHEYSVFESKDVFGDMIIGFDYIEVELLPSPYVTNCIDYKKSFNCMSRAHCIEKCHEQFEMSKFGRHAFDVHHQIDNTSKYDSIPLFQHQINNLTALKERLHYLTTECERLVRNTDCREQFYVNHKMQRNRWTNRKVTLCFYPKNRPPVSCKALPVLPPVDFVVYVLSVLGFWLAISPLAVLEWLGERYSRRSNTIEPNLQHQLNLEKVKVKRLKSVIRELENRMNDRFNTIDQEIVKIKLDVIHQ